MFCITTERPEDRAAIETLLDQAFGPERQAKASYRYRVGVGAVAGLCFAAREGERIVGTLRFWPVLVGGGAQPALLLGPLAVAADRRGTSIGSTLMYTGLDAAIWARHALVLLVGELAYYRRFGFGPAAPGGGVMPGETSSRLLLRELVPGAAALARGTVRPWRDLRGGSIALAA